MKQAKSKHRYICRVGTKNSWRKSSKRIIKKAIGYVRHIEVIIIGFCRGIVKNKVLCFIGDSASYCGITLESIRYSRGHNLPILFIVEDNDKSVRANTLDTWGLGFEHKEIEYFYDMEYPHAGTGAYVIF